MVTIRMARGGAKKRPFYHIVATDSRNRRDGRNLERLGFFNPVGNPEKQEILRLDLERVDYWLSKGAQVSRTVTKLIADARKQANQKPVSTEGEAEAV